MWLGLAPGLKFEKLLGPLPGAGLKFKELFRQGLGIDQRRAHPAHAVIKCMLHLAYRNSAQEQTPCFTSARRNS